MTRIDRLAAAALRCGFVWDVAVSPMDRLRFGSPPDEVVIVARMIGHARELVASATVRTPWASDARHDHVAAGALAAAHDVLASLLIEAVREHFRQVDLGVEPGPLPESTDDVPTYAVSVKPARRTPEMLVPGPWGLG